MATTTTRGPTDALRDEHRLILRALDLLRLATARLEDGGRLPNGWWENLLEWLRTFADRNHHGKEEAHLFPALTRAGVPAAGGPIGVMLEEHAEGRALIGIMTEGRPDRRLSAAHAYAHLLGAHIEKENGVLFPLAEVVLDEQCQAVLAREFEKVEAEHGPAASLDGAEAALKRLATALRV